MILAFLISELTGRDSVGQQGQKSKDNRLEGSIRFMA